jgi:uncharacterized membrane protein (UPF0127 family)
MRALFLILIIAMLPACGAGADTKIVFSNTVIELKTKKGAFKLKVLEARTNPQLSRGLMFRSSLRPWDGMIFDFATTQEVHIWMKNTLIPLDIIFIKQDGNVESVGIGKPLSLATVSSKGLVRSVLELPLGSVKRYGIAVGDHITHPMFSPKQ